MAVPFDPDRLEISSSPVSVLERIRSSGTGAQFALSRSGTLAYVSGAVEATTSRLVWVDRRGVAEPVPASARRYQNPQLSPDGRQIAVGSVGDVWVYDISRDALTRRTFEGRGNSNPTWSPDGQRIAFVSTREGPVNMFWQTADDSSVPERLMPTDSQTIPASFSPDEQRLAFTETNPETGRDIWILNLADRDAHPFVSTPYEETAPKFPPDGKWLAYSSDESGRREVYVQPYPGPGRKWQISNEGGQEPDWNPDGSELFYRIGSAMMAVAIDLESGSEAGTPQLLFDGPYLPTAFSFANYDVGPDARRFLMLEPIGPEFGGATQINVVLNWAEELKRLVPTEH